MAVSRGSKAAVAGARTRLTFEVERFGWVADDRIEVAGRWFGLRGHRFLRPTLDVEVDGRHRRLLALLDHKPWAAEEGDEWVAAFGWHGEPAQLEGAELAVGQDLTIELPAPSGGRAPSTTPPARTRDLLAAGRPRAEIELELSTARDEAERLESELERLSTNHAGRVEELQRRIEAEREALAQLKEELAAARAGAAALEAESAARIEQLSAERDAAVAASSASLAETKRIESERDAALRARAAVEQERDAAVRARDSARQERNAWMSRARTAVAERSAPATGTVRRRATAPPKPPQKPAPKPPPAEERQPPEPAPPPGDPAPRRTPRARAAAPKAAPPPVARPGVRTVRIGFDDSHARAAGAGAGDEASTALLAVPPPRWAGPRRTVPLWASWLLALLALILAIAAVALLIA
jgi:hypothetical protein